MDAGSSPLDKAQHVNETDPVDLGLDDLAALDDMRQLRHDFARFLMHYKFGMDEIVTKISILRDEFTHLHDYNPIEHISSRLKSPESILEKMRRKDCDPSLEAIRSTITDIAGVRVTCSFVSDTYRVFDMLTRQTDIRVVDVRDYIKAPKPNGYTSLHALVEVPVFLSDGPVPVIVEVQIRTIAMDFWASLEHKIYYKYQRQVPDELLVGLREAADTARRLDDTMESLHAEVKGLSSLPDDPWTRARLDPGTVADERLLRQLRGLRPDRD